MGNKGNKKPWQLLVWGPYNNLGTLKSLQQISREGGFLHSVFMTNISYFLYINHQKPKSSHECRPTYELMREERVFE